MVMIICSFKHEPIFFWGGGGGGLLDILYGNWHLHVKSYNILHCLAHTGELWVAVRDL